MGCTTDSQGQGPGPVGAARNIRPLPCDRIASANALERVRPRAAVVAACADPPNVIADNAHAIGPPVVRRPNAVQAWRRQRRRRLTEDRLCDLAPRLSPLRTAAISYRINVARRRNRTAEWKRARRRYRCGLSPRPQPRIVTRWEEATRGPTHSACPASPRQNGWISVRRRYVMFAARSSFHDASHSARLDYPLPWSHRRLVAL